MTNHANDVTIGYYASDNTVTIVMRGKLEENIEGLRCRVLRAPGVKSAIIVDDQPIIIATCRLETPAPSNSPQQIRLRIRNCCRDWFQIVSGYPTNTGVDGNYVDLVEDVQVAV